MRSDLALEAVAAAEGIEVSASDVEEEISKLAERYAMEADKVRGIIKEEDLRRDLSIRKALESVKAAVKKPAKRSSKKADKAEDKPADDEKTEE